MSKAGAQPTLKGRDAEVGPGALAKLSPAVGGHILTVSNCGKAVGGGSGSPFRSGRCIPFPMRAQTMQPLHTPQHTAQTTQCSGHSAEYCAICV